MVEELSNIKMSDGTIIAIKGYSGDVTVYCEDYQGKLIDLVFSNVIGLLAYSPERVDLSHITCSSKSSVIDEALRASEEDLCGHVCYDFISAWSEQPILRIVASGIECINPNL